MNRDALAHLQVGRAALSHKQTLSWTMHDLLRKFPSNAKFLLKTTLMILATTPRPLSHAHPNSSWQTAEPLCRNTVEQTKCYKSGTATHLALVVVGETYTYNVCAKPLWQRTKHCSILEYCSTIYGYYIRVS